MQNNKQQMSNQSNWYSDYIKVNATLLVSINGDVLISQFLPVHVYFTCPFQLINEIYFYYKSICESQVFKKKKMQSTTMGMCV